MRTTPCLTVAVIGAGIVGLTAALEILRAGHEVLIIEPAEPGGRQAASYGNGAWLSPGSVMPMSVPGLWRKVPGYLSDPTGPFTIRWQHLPRLAPWLLRFILAGRDWARTRSLRGPAFPAVQGYGQRACGACRGGWRAGAHTARGIDVRLSRPVGVPGGRARMDASQSLWRRLPGG